VSSSLRASVDAQVCVGTGLCEATAPDLFEVGDDGVAHVLGEALPDDRVAAAREAADNCPTRALTVGP
jgi:ferredoxin